MIDKLLETLKAFGAQIDDSELLLALEETEERFEKLKPVVPQCVADWFEEKRRELTLNEMLDSLDRVVVDPQNVGLYFDDFSWDEVYILLANMAQFGYIIEPEKRYRIKAPVDWDRDEDEEFRFLYLSPMDDEDGYALHSEFSATTYTKQEAEELMKRLKVDWELEEVEG